MPNWKAPLAQGITSGADNLMRGAIAKRDLDQRQAFYNQRGAFAERDLAQRTMADAKDRAFKEKELAFKHRQLVAQYGWKMGDPKFAGDSNVPMSAAPAAMPFAVEDTGSPDVGPTAPVGNFRSLPSVQPNENIQEPPTVPDFKPTQVAGANMLLDRPRYDFPREY